MRRRQPRLEHLASLPVQGSRPPPSAPTSRRTPALVSVGSTDTGDTWLVDLKRVDAMSLDGSPDRCLNLARFLAAELGHSLWSEQLRVRSSASARRWPADAGSLGACEGPMAAVTGIHQELH